MAARGGILKRARAVKLIILDVDGVLTDGRIILGSDGTETKNFNVRDGFGLVMARHVGLKTALITAERSAVVDLRARRLKIDWVKQFSRDKLLAFRQCLAHFKLKPADCAFIGDDWLDLPVLLKVGLAATVPSASSEIKQRVHYVTRLAGGHGAVREFIELILKAQGHWPKLLSRYAS